MGLLGKLLKKSPVNQTDLTLAKELDNRCAGFRRLVGLLEQCLEKLDAPAHVQHLHLEPNVFARFKSEVSSVSTFQGIGSHLLLFADEYSKHIGQAESKPEIWKKLFRNHHRVCTLATSLQNLQGLGQILFSVKLGLMRTAKSWSCLT